MKVAAPDRRRVRQHRGLKARRQRAPLATRTLLALSVLGLAAVAFVAASGGINPLLSTLGNGFTVAFGRLTATPLPSSTQLPPTDSPRLASPDQPYTSDAMVELRVTVPFEVVGDPTAKVRVYLALEGLEAVPVVDMAVGTTTGMTIPFELTPGRNDISASLFRGGEESEPSLTVTWILDTEQPKITVSSPKNNATVDDSEVTLRGSTQAGTSLVARNAGNGTSIASLAGTDGTFEFGMILAPGTNEITITGTDPAGNVGETMLTLLQGSQEMDARLTASSYRIDISRHPASLQLVVLVTDPSGAPLAGAQAFFTLQIPGLGPISNQLVTGADGRAVFTTPLVGELDTGGGVGTVLVTHEDFGQSTDRVTLTFVK